ncbi:MAG: porin, partial [Anaeromyxobacteraceae bacterium]|nr:porin [Anaeromyxobacteraceae bacterium]
MKNRFIAAVAALALAPAALAQEAAPATPAVDVAALEGKVEALAEQYAETKNDVASLKKLKFSG